MRAAGSTDEVLRRSERHVNTLGYIYTGIGAFQFFTVLIILIVTVLLPSLSSNQEDHGSLSGPTLLIVLFLLLFAIPSLPGGIGLLGRKRWARTLILIVGCLKLFGVPLCTILGIFTIKILTRKQVKQLFSSQSSIESSAEQ